MDTPGEQSGSESTSQAPSRAEEEQVKHLREELSDEVRGLKKKKRSVCRFACANARQRRKKHKSNVLNICWKN